MKKRITNAVTHAAPATIWGNAVPGKCGASTNYDATKRNSAVRSEIQRMSNGKNSEVCNG